MGELTVTAFVTLDGVMQAPGGPDEDRDGGFAWGGWMHPYPDDVFGGFITDVFERAGAFLLGRRTYDIFAAYWPDHDDPADPVASRLNRLPKHVASRTRERFDWSGSRHVAEVAREVPELKRATQGELQVHGSPGLIQTLHAHDLVDEWRLLLVPVAVGPGKRLFEDGTTPRAFELTGARSTGTGATILVYRRGGPLRTGSFA